MSGATALLTDEEADSSSEFFAEVPGPAPPPGEPVVGNVIAVLSRNSGEEEPADDHWPWVRLPDGGLELRCEPDAG